MNIAMLKRLDGAVVKLRPVVQRVWNGQHLEALDQDWRIEVAKSGNAVLRLHSIASGHFVDVYSDGVQEFREPGFLFVKDQFTITEKGIVREPIADRRLLYKDPR